MASAAAADAAAMLAVAVTAAVRARFGMHTSIEIVRLNCDNLVTVGFRRESAGALVAATDPSGHLNRAPCTARS